MLIKLCNAESQLTITDSNHDKIDSRHGTLMCEAGCLSDMGSLCKVLNLFGGMVQVVTVNRGGNKQVRARQPS